MCVIPWGSSCNVTTSYTYNMYMICITVCCNPLQIHAGYGCLSNGAKCCFTATDWANCTVCPTKRKSEYYNLCTYVWM